MLEPGSPEIRRKFARWRDANPAHARAYAELGPYAGLATRLPPPERHGPRASTFFRPAFAAAIAVLVVIVGALVLSGRASSPAFASISNAGPAVRVIGLSDGTTIVLDPGSALSVRVGAHVREVKFHKGRARFNVASSTAQPFAICSSIACVRSVGGVVDISLQGARARVDSLRGTATAEPNSRALVTLAPGAAVTIDGQSVRRIVLTRRQLLWPAARVGFDDARLADVVAAANRIAKPPIRLDGQGLGARRVTGVLDLRDGNALATKLAATLNLNIEHAPDAVILTP